MIYYYPAIQSNSQQSPLLVLKYAPTEWTDYA